MRSFWYPALFQLLREFTAVHALHSAVRMSDHPHDLFHSQFQYCHEKAPHHTPVWLGDHTTRILDDFGIPVADPQCRRKSSISLVSIQVRTASFLVRIFISHIRLVRPGLYEFFVVPEYFFYHVHSTSLCVLYFMSAYYQTFNTSPSAPSLTVRNLINQLR